MGTCLQNSSASNGALNVNCTLSSLPAGANRHVRIIGNVLGSVPDGVQVTFAANVDPNNSVPERNDTDNTAFMITTLRAPSDLQITAGPVTKTTIALAVAQDNCLVGAFAIGCPNNDVVLVEVRFNVKNNGPYRSRATSVGAVWTGAVTDLSAVCPAGTSFNPQSRTCVEGSSSGTCFSSCPLRALNPGEVVTVVHTGIIAANKPAAPVTVTATADPNRTVLESIIGNNRVTSSLTAP